MIFSAENEKKVLDEKEKLPQKKYQGKYNYFTRSNFCGN
jgi:hypothetical protein